MNESQGPDLRMDLKDVRFVHDFAIISSELTGPDSPG